MRKHSLEGKLAGLFLLIGSVAVGLSLALHHWLGEQPLLIALFALLVLVPASLWLARAFARPITGLMRAVSGAVASFRDGDFSFSIHTGRRDEVGDLVEAHNELGTVLRNERQNLFQRELLLHTVVQNTPTALLLADGGEHVVYANTAARQLLNNGRKLEGLSFETMLADCPPSMRDAVASGQDRIFSVLIDGQDESFHIAQRQFQLNGQPHRLFLIRRLTRELSRQEVATWKKVIRVISHELNNSLAPISSLAHSGRELAARGDTERLQRVFATIEDRTRHLDNFIRGYAAFAKLPSPRVESVAWADFVASLSGQYAFNLVGRLPETPGRFDAAQLGQVLINLLKNAHESGGAADTVELEIAAHGADWRISVRDRGTGMSDAVMANALVPFYSTKRSGTGIGLALAREIIEAHGGRIGLGNRQGGGLAVDLYLPRVDQRADSQSDKP